MALYTQSTSLPNVQWPEPMETVWQVLPSGPGVPGSKIPHLSLADELFVAAVANIRRPARPWGAITWLADVFQISRPTIYALGHRAGRGLVREVGWPAQPGVGGQQCQRAAPAVTIRSPSRPTGWCARRLTLAFPGPQGAAPDAKSAWRTAFGQRPAWVGTLSELG